MSDYVSGFFYRPNRATKIEIDFTNFKLSKKDDIHSHLFSNFKEKVRVSIIDTLMQTNRLPEDKSTIFVDKLLSPNFKKNIEIDRDIDKYHTQGGSEQECARFLLDKYYDITKINFFPTEYNHEQITESTQFNTVSPSLFWNFVNRLKRLELGFIFNTRYTKNTNNSLNSGNYNLYMETNPVDSLLVKQEFKHSKLLSSVVSSIDLLSDGLTHIKFYMGIDYDSNINFGYIINNEKIRIGKFKYKTNDMHNLIDMIQTTDYDIDLNRLFKRFLSTLFLIQYYKKIFSDNLQSYDDINIYTDVIDNKLTVVIELMDSDILNRDHLDNMVKNNLYIKMPFKYKWNFDIKRNNKIIYYFSL